VGEFQEAEPRTSIPRNIDPGETFVLDVTVTLPDAKRGDRWFVDLVNEQFFWFSKKGSEPAEVVLV
jgi:hypothetical protein